jgi:hypothetical protein
MAYLPYREATQRVGIKTFYNRRTALKSVIFSILQKSEAAAQHPHYARWLHCGLDNIDKGTGLKKVILESPYAGNVARNEHYARLALHDCLVRHNEAPIASHLLYTQPQVLDDTVPAERTLGIEAGLLWGDCAEQTVVYEDFGYSNGMKYGIERAKKAGRPIEIRRLPPEIFAAEFPEEAAVLATAEK